MFFFVGKPQFCVEMKVAALTDAGWRTYIFHRIGARYRSLLQYLPGP